MYFGLRTLNPWASSKPPKPNPLLWEDDFQMKIWEVIFDVTKKDPLTINDYWKIRLSLRSLVLANSPWWCNQTRWNPLTNQWIPGIGGFWTTGFYGQSFSESTFHVYGCLWSLSTCPWYFFVLLFCWKNSKTMLFWWWPYVLQKVPFKCLWWIILVSNKNAESSFNKTPKTM